MEQAPRDIGADLARFALGLRPLEQRFPALEERLQLVARAAVGLQRLDVAPVRAVAPQGGQALLGAGWRFVRRIAFQPEFGVLLALCLSSTIFTALSPHYVSTSQLGNIMVVAALSRKVGRAGAKLAIKGATAD